MHVGIWDGICMVFREDDLALLRVTQRCWEKGIMISRRIIVLFSSFFHLLPGNFL
jgi:hypothetical protein